MKSRQEIEKSVLTSISTVKPSVTELNFNSKIVTDLGFESVDIIDLFFEIQSVTEIEIDLNEISDRIGGLEGRRFNDITVQDIISYLESKL